MSNDGSLFVEALKQGVSKQGITTFAWRPGSQYDVAATRGANSALARDCRAQFGHPSTRRGCRICVTVRLPVRPRREAMYWQANANTPLSVTPFKCALFVSRPNRKYRNLTKLLTVEFSEVGAIRTEIDGNEQGALPQSGGQKCFHHLTPKPVRHSLSGVRGA